MIDATEPEFTARKLTPGELREWDALTIETSAKLPWIIEVLLRLTPYVLESNLESVVIGGFDSYGRVAVPIKDGHVHMDIHGLMHGSLHLLFQHFQADSPEQIEQQYQDAQCIYVNNDMRNIITASQRGSDRNFHIPDPDVELYSVKITPYQFPDDATVEEYFHMLTGAQSVPFDPSTYQNRCLRAEFTEDIAAAVDELFPGSKMTNTELTDIGRIVAGDILSHEDKQPGSMPAGLLRYVDEYLNPTIFWGDVLAEFISVRRDHKLLNGRKTWTHVNRRAVSWGELRFTHRSSTLTGVVAVDTSGSMSKGDLTECVAEISGILECENITSIQFFAVDTEATAVQTVSTVSELNLTGGGGTDMCVAFDVVRGMTVKPDFFILLTDGYTDYPSEPLDGIDTIIVITSSGRADTPVWAKTIHIKQ